jgi:L-asparaginase
MSVILVSTGGTIAMRPDPETGELLPAVSGEELAETIGWPDAPPLEVDQYANVPSLDIHGELAVGLARRVLEHAAREPDGIVVIHGTDTMEETAYLIDLVLPPGSVPVVITGAQRTAADRDADGPRNLRDAIRLASTPEARGLGVVVCFGGEIHAAREVTKVHSTALTPFASPGYGPLGQVQVEGISIRHQPRARVPLELSSNELPRVDLIRLYAGADAVFVEASVAAGARAIVLEGTGRGNGNRTIIPAVREAVEAGVLVAVTSRCAAGAVDPAYGAGGGRDLAEAGAIFLGDLAGPKARVLLQLALAAGTDPEAAVAAEAR